MKKGHLSCFSLSFKRSPDIWLETVFHQTRDCRQKSKQKLPWEINTTVFILKRVLLFSHYIIGILKYSHGNTCFRRGNILTSFPRLLSHVHYHQTRRHTITVRFTAGVCNYYKIIVTLLLLLLLLLLFTV